MEGLQDKRVSVRADAVAELGRTADTSAVMMLIELSRRDKSRSIQICAAAAAADILARHRGASGQTPVPEDLKDSLLATLSKVDPAALPQLLLCYAVFPTVPVIKRLMRMLRDPRYGVRAGSMAAIRRMALSGAAQAEGTGLREWVGDTLDHRKLPLDAAVDLARLVGQAGWHVLSPRIERLPAGEIVDEAVSTALKRLAAREESDTWRGIWIDEGRDVMELKPTVSGPWSTLAGTESQEGKRLIWAPRLAEEGDHVALQEAGRTAWKLTPERAVAVICGEDAALSERDGAGEILLPMLDEIGGQPAARAAALLLVRTSRFGEAIERLQKPLSGKRPRNDLFFLRGLARVGIGDKKAGEDLERYLSKAKKSEPWVEEARALLG